LPATIAHQTAAPVRSPTARALAFDGLFGLLYRDQFREFAGIVGGRPKLCVPENIWDKYLWRKIFDHDPKFTVFCDKLAAKTYAASRCPDLPAARVLWRGRGIDEAPPELLAGPGYLKSNYGSGFFLKLDEQPRRLDELRAITKGWHRGWHHTKPKKWKYRGQWGYKNVPRMLFIEEDLGCENSGPFLDFAVYVFGGNVTHFTVMLDHKSDRVQFARIEPSGMRAVRETKGPQRGGKTMPLPEDFKLPVSADDVCDFARRIAANSDHLRIDLMWNGKDLHFSEITVYSNAGFVRYKDEVLLAEMTQAWDLRRSWFLTHKQTGWRRLYADWLRRTLDASEPHPSP